MTDSIGDRLATVLPKLRTKLQLTGMAVMIVGSLLAHFAQPGNTAAMLTGGAIGVSIIIFAQLFHFLTVFPENSRASTFLASFAMFCVLVLALIVATVVLLGRPSMAVTLEPQAVLQKAKTQFDGGALTTQETHPLLWRTSGGLEMLPKPFAADMNDDLLRQEEQKFGTGVTYSATEKDGVLEIEASMPYERKMHGEGFITPLTVNRFRWLPPVLSFKISNPRSQILLLSKGEIKAASVTNEDTPILIVDDVMPQGGDGDADNVRFPLDFYNMSWGLVRTPQLEFSVVRDADIEKAAGGPFMHMIKARSFDGDVQFDLADYIDPTMEKQRVETETVVSDMLSWSAAVNSSAGAFIDYLNVVGRLSFLTERNESRTANFRVRVYFSHFGPGRVNPSYKYNVFLPDELKDFPVSVPISQCVAGHSADNFLMSFRSRRSTRYDMTINVQSTDDVVLSQRVVLHTMVSRNYGLAHPKETESFSEKQGCT